MSSGVLELFREACGSAARLQLEVVGPDGEPSRRVDLQRPFALIGRDRRADIRLDAAVVSPRHVYLQLIGGWPFFVDLGSRSGTLWQGQRRKDGWLKAGDVLALGPCSVRPIPEGMGSGDNGAAGAPTWDPLQAEAAEQLHSPILSLEVAGGAAECPRRRLDRVLTLVGRASACPVRLADRSVSPFHCALLRTGQGLWIVDLLGKGGVWVNGRQMRWARLEDEARLQVGCFAFRVRFPRPAYRASADQFLEAQSIGEPRAIDGQRPHEFLSGSEPEECPSVQDASRLVSADPELSSTFSLSNGLVPLGSFPLAPRAPFNGASLPALAMQQFAVLQQQLLSQFQQSMLMLAQMMTAWREEERDLLREVIKRLGRLKPAAGRSASERQKQEARRKRKAASKQGSESSTTSADPTLPSGPDQSPHPEPTASDGAATAPEPPAGETLDPNFHAWLSGRIAALDEDRQGTWRKFLGMLLGK